jgi:hypothetical protein
MQKSKILLAALSAAVLFGASPVKAQTSGSSYYNPSGDQDGCNAATYAEPWDSMYQWWYWDVPALANGESVGVANSVYWWNSYSSGWIPAEENPNPVWLNFTCNYGVIGGGAGMGYWW